MKTKKIIVGVAQGLLSIAMLMAGVMKVITPYEELITQMTWAKSVASPLVVLIGVLEVLGVVGMNLPFIIKKYKQLVPVAAGGLTLTMLGAVVTHILIGDSFGPPLFLLVLAGFVTFSRFELIRKNELQASA
jgi:hypothetical protein